MTKKLVSIENESVTITFDDGESVTLATADISTEMQVRAMLHGLSQKLGDSYAGAASEADPLAYAKSAVADVIANLKAGDWRAATTGTGGSRVSDLALALAELQGIDIAQAVEALAESTDEQKDTLRKHPRVAAVMARIKAAKAAERAAKAAEKAANSDLPITL